MKTKRIELYDIAKGILISMVVVGHIITMSYPVSAIIKTFIYTFHVPAFFIITGMLTKATLVDEYKFIPFVKKKFKSLLLPYLLFEFVAAISQMLFLGMDYLNIKGALINTLLVYCNAGATWFLPTLFIAEIIYYWILLINKKYGKILSLFLVVLCGGVSFVLPKTHFFIVVARCLLGVGFVWIGMFCAKSVVAKCIANRRLGIGSCLSSFVVTLIIASANGKVGMNLCEFNNPILYVLGSVSGTYFILFLAHFVHSRILLYIGKNSLVILGTHLNVIVIIEKLFLGGGELKIDLWIPILLIVIIFEILFIRAYNKAIQ